MIATFRIVMFSVLAWSGIAPGALADDPPLDERLEAIRSDYQAKELAVYDAMEKAPDQRTQNKLYTEMAPDIAAYCRRMIDIALTDPKHSASRDALLWVINHPGRQDAGPYGDEFARAGAILVRYHGDDPEAVRAGLGLDNITSLHRDALLYGFLATAKSHESKGLARMSLAKYLIRKAEWAESARKSNGRQKYKITGFVDDDGKIVEKEFEQSDEEYAYAMHCRMADPDALSAEAERLFEEVIAEYGDVPYIGLHIRELERALKQPTPMLNGRVLSEDDVRQIKHAIETRGAQTLAMEANARLDDLRNLAVGKPAPEIDGVDFDGKPLRLSDYRGKVVALVFWGTWCGPCMREVPHEREMVERLKGKPFALLGVDCDEDQEVARKVMNDERMTWPQWHDGAPGEGPIARRYHVQGYPTVVVIDAQGNIRAKNVIGSPLDELVDKLIVEAEGVAPKDK